MSDPAGPRIRLRPQPGADAAWDAGTVAVHELTRLDGAPDVGALGTLGLQRVGPGRARVTCTVEAEHRRRGVATAALAAAAAHASSALGVHRLEALVACDDLPGLRTARAAGLRREGVARAVLPTPGGGWSDAWQLALLASDPTDPVERRWGAVRAELPRRLVASGVVARDREGRALVVEPTYKEHWEVVGGLAEPGEGLREAAMREVLEEVGGVLPVGELLAVDAVGGRDGAPGLLAFLFDGGVHDAGLATRLAFTDGELASAAWVDADGARARRGPRPGARLAAVLDAFTTGRLPDVPLVLRDGVPEP
ncbi:GNAT family N-acetyltransferase [Angustibacter aerolatus]